ncbi:Hypothetical predicted protein [Cloeon dipterum]|uniref:C2H2-type domain-containing protein n=1 Tax=Cloeon dipterum TaxID=197152 RepID=A0A8S1DLS2_9INSE|nr:Hypothetical predicted protein [Cloeon dipterum]
MHGTGSHLECDNCKKKFSSKISLAHHVSEAHKKKKCRFCEQNVLWLNNHLNHKKERKDCKPPLHQCTKCLKVFSFKCRFERHTKRKTSATTAPKAEFCWDRGRIRDPSQSRNLTPVPAEI